MNAFIGGLFGALGVVVALFAATQFSSMVTLHDDSDPAFGRSGMTVLTDHKTGLQYLRSGAAITPRYGADGKQTRGDS